MTRDELEFQANRIITLGKASLELQSEFSFLALLHRPGYGWKPYRMPAGTEELMNIGKAKREIFGFFRMAVRVNHCDAVLFALDTWKGVTTEEGAKHYGTGEWIRNVDQGYRKLQQMGWAKVGQALTITVQTEIDVLIVSQIYQRLNDCIQLLECKREWYEQKHFGGRQKMFGDLREENLGEHPADFSGTTPAKS
jgi:hypothetical protein